MSGNSQIERSCNKALRFWYDNDILSRVWQKPAVMVGASRFNRIAVVLYACCRIMRSILFLALAIWCHTFFRSAKALTCPKRRRIGRVCSHFSSTVQVLPPRSAFIISPKNISMALLALDFAPSALLASLLEELLEELGSMDSELSSNSLSNSAGIETRRVFLRAPATVAFCSDDFVGRGGC